MLRILGRQASEMQRLKNSLLSRKHHSNPPSRDCSMQNLQTLTATNACDIHHPHSHPHPLSQVQHSQPASAHCNHHRRSQDDDERGRLCASTSGSSIALASCSSSSTKRKRKMMVGLMFGARRSHSNRSLQDTSMMLMSGGGGSVSHLGSNGNSAGGTPTNEPSTPTGATGAAILSAANVVYATTSGSRTGSQTSIGNVGIDVHGVTSAAASGRSDSIDRTPPSSGYGADFNFSTAVCRSFTSIDSNCSTPQSLASPDSGKPRYSSPSASFKQRSNLSDHHQYHHHPVESSGSGGSVGAASVDMDSGNGPVAPPAGSTSASPKSPNSPTMVRSLVDRVCRKSKACETLSLITNVFQYLSVPRDEPSPATCGRKVRSVSYDEMRLRQTFGAMDLSGRQPPSNAAATDHARLERLHLAALNAAAANLANVHSRPGTSGTTLTSSPAGNVNDRSAESTDTIQQLAAAAAVTASAATPPTDPLTACIQKSRAQPQCNANLVATVSIGATTAATTCATTAPHSMHDSIGRTLELPFVRSARSKSFDESSANALRVAEKKTRSGSISALQIPKWKLFVRRSSSSSSGRNSPTGLQPIGTALLTISNHDRCVHCNLAERLRSAHEAAIDSITGHKGHADLIDLMSLGSPDTPPIHASHLPAASSSGQPGPLPAAHYSQCSSLSSLGSRRSLDLSFTNSIDDDMESHPAPMSISTATTIAPIVVGGPNPLIGSRLLQRSLTHSFSNTGSEDDCYLVSPELGLPVVTLSIAADTSSADLVNQCSNTLCPLFDRYRKLSDTKSTAVADLQPSSSSAASVKQLQVTGTGCKFDFESVCLVANKPATDSDVLETETPPAKITAVNPAPVNPIESDAIDDPTQLGPDGQRENDKDVDQMCFVADCPNRLLLQQWMNRSSGTRLPSVGLGLGPLCDPPASPDEEGVTVTVLSLEVPVLKQSRSASIDASFLKVPADVFCTASSSSSPEPVDADSGESLLFTGGKTQRSHSVDIALPVQPDGHYAIVQSNRSSPVFEK